MKIKKFFWPFSRKDRDMKKYWWHRLFAIVFVIILVSSFVGIFLKLSNDDVAGRSGCESSWAHIYNTKTEQLTGEEMNLEYKYHYDKSIYQNQLDDIEKEMTQAQSDYYGNANNCTRIYPILWWFDLVASLVFLVILNYLLPLTYYKIFLYIVFGSDTKRKE